MRTAEQERAALVEAAVRDVETVVELQKETNAVQRRVQKLQIMSLVAIIVTLVVVWADLVIEWFQ